MTDTTSSEPLAADPLSWAKSHFATELAELLEDFPSNKLYRLDGPTEVAWLRVLPVAPENAVSAVEIISRHLEGAVPSVMAVNRKHGAILVRDVETLPLGDSLSPAQFRALLTAYADIQAKALATPELLESVPAMDVATLVDDLLRFLDPAVIGEGPNQVGAAFFVGEDDARKFHEAMRAREDLLRRFISPASQLPPTLCHCNLSPQNATETDSGEIVIHNWENAMTGPAGASLPQLFNGCGTVNRALGAAELDEDDASARLHRALLSHYIHALATRGYADEATLRTSLPAAAACGTLHGIIKFGAQPLNDLVYRKSVGELIRARVTELLDLTDLLAAGSRSLTFLLAEAYYAQGEPLRSEQVLMRYLQDHPNDSETHYRLGNLYLATQQWDKAAGILPRVASLYPSDPVTRNNLGYTLMMGGRYLEALSEFDAALTLDPTFEKAVVNRETAAELMVAAERARLPHVAPTITLRPDWSDYHYAEPAKIAFSTQMMREHGTLLIENAFPREHIEEMRELVFSGKYDRYFVEKDHPDAMQTGDKRYMVTLDIEGPLSSPVLYRNRFLDTLMRRVLGEDYIIGALHVVLSLPGARDMRVHKDHPALFRDPGSPMVTLPFAVSMMVPLMDMTPELGTTRLMKGSHLYPDEAPAHLPVQDHYLQAGSCLLFDFRLTHQGLANRSNQIRPLFFITYYRPWFRDIVNFDLQPSISLSQQEYDAMPPDIQRRFKWTRYADR